MTVLIRALSAFPKWKSPPSPFQAGEIPSTEIRGELNATKDNALSFWEVDETQGGWEKHAALILLGTFQANVTGLDMVWIKVDDVAKWNVVVRPQPGDNYIASLRDLHRDLVVLDGFRWGAISHEVGLAAVQRDQMRSFTRQELKLLLLDAIASGIADKAQLSKGLKALVDDT